MQNIMLIGFFPIIFSSIQIVCLLSEENSLTTINIILSLWSLLASLSYFIIAITTLVYKCYKKLSNQQFNREIIKIHQDYPCLCVYYIIKLLTLTFLIILKRFINSSLQVRTLSQICFTITLAFLVILYQQNLAFILKNTHLIKKIINNNQVKFIIDLYLWNAGIFTFALYQILSFENENGIFLGTLCCLCSYNFIQAGIISFRISPNVWLITWGIPGSIFTGFILDIILFKNNHFFFNKIRYICGGILGLMLVLYLHKTYQIIKIKVLRYFQKKKQKQQQQKYIRRLELKINHQKNNNDQSQNTPQIFDFNRLSKQNWQCSICMVQQNKNMIMLNCSHVFHSDCIKEWVKISFTCPICRAQRDEIV